MNADFTKFFTALTGHPPYPYQVRLATSPWPDLLNVPTGLGKTAAVVASWLWKIRSADPTTPRRIVYCLPMRVLVEQTMACIERWLDRAAPWFKDKLPSTPRAHLLMGGDTDESWIRYPEKPAILIGTQDMLISRALLRGYGQSRYQWPWSFGLLHNDAQWVFDEVQLMDSALATSAQLEGFRRQFGTVMPCRSLWMSATMGRDWLATIDFRQDSERLTTGMLADDDRVHAEARRRLEAKKPLKKSSLMVGDKDYAKKLAIEIQSQHQPETLTLVIVNSVRRAIELHEQLKKTRPVYDLQLLHSRFRGYERSAMRLRLESPLPKTGRIIVSTQVVEAGVDLDARLLFTELAPWPSLIQRFGRCNRSGTISDAAVHWIDIDIKGAPPYELSELSLGRERLEKQQEVGPSALINHSLTIEHTVVLRRRDFLEMFDTTPDLTGYDVDISHYIRDVEDHDVRVFWRAFDGTAPSETEAQPSPSELCPVPCGDAREWIEKKNRPAWKWDALEGTWVRVAARQIYPGINLLLSSGDGGYDPAVGWALNKTAPVEQVPEAIMMPSEAMSSDVRSEGTWTTLTEHTNRVLAELAIILSPLRVPDALREDLTTAGQFHDLGKAHPVFQATMLGNPPANDVQQIWAKTVHRNARHARRGFRHELVSALVLLQHQYSDLVAYLAGAHHGRVRVSVRSLPNESSPRPSELDGKERRFALGVWEGDRVPTVSCAGGTAIPETVIDLSCIELGDGPSGASWTARILALLHQPDLGPFRLAYLEALLRAADARGSEVKA
ncbi:MAG: DEAD/DEAH box helicase [Candidatus Ozemobacteraceae bacterium]